MELNCEIIAVGTELLLGNITNTNARFLSEELANAGVNVLYQSVVGDNPESLKEVFNTALNRTNLVILTGGLGPTPDDLTKETVFDALGLQSEFIGAEYDKILEYFAHKGKECPESNKKQACFPKEAIILKNSNGTAPGCILPLDSKTVVILPGPPKELKPMFLDSVKPYLKEKTGSIIFSRTLKLFGIGESEASEKIADLLDGENPTAAFYAKTGRVEIRVTAKGTSENQAELLVLSLIHKIENKLGDYIYGYDNDTLQSVAVGLLKKYNKTVATAESITGGLISKKITDVSGASQVFESGFCTYSNAAKANYLKVNKKTLKVSSAISGEVAELMAEGAMKQDGADYGVSATGLAGPASDESGKPVGTVYIAVSHKNGTAVKKLFLSRGIENDREYIRELTSMHALSLLIKVIKETCGEDSDKAFSDISQVGAAPVNTKAAASAVNDDEDTKIDAFMAALQERRIDTDTAEKSETDNPIAKALSETPEKEEPKAEENTPEEPLDTNLKRSYNFELFE